MKKNNNFIKNIFLIIVIIAMITLIVYFINKLKTLKKNNKINITIFASSKDIIDKEYFEKTRELITKLNQIKDDIDVIYGGGEKGLMGEVSKYKGNIISSNVKMFVTPTMKDEYVFDNINDRQDKLIELGDVYIILPGGYGTHYELLEVMTLNDIKASNKPIILYNINNFFDKFINHINDITNTKFIENNLKKINAHIFYNPDEIIQFIQSLKNNKQK
jgi:uncharacterized protein (TIGR00730 family)